MVKPAVLLLLTCSAVPCFADAPAPPSTTQPAPDSRSQPVYHINPWVDVPALVGGAVLWVTPYLVVVSSGSSRSACDPCDPSQLNALDRPFARFHNSDSRVAANVLFAVPAAYALFDLFDAGPRNWRSFLGDYVVVGEAVAWDGALQQIVSHAVRRPRPFMYQAGVYPTERASSDANSSFYSGHTSATFALSTSFAFTYHMRNPRSPWRIAVWAGLLAVATAESMLRVSSGDHFPTDVMVGAVMGSTFGLVIPALHRREIIPGVSSLGLVPSVERDRTTFSLAGRF